MNDEEPLDPNTLYADGFEKALIGLGWQHTKLIAEAIEWMEYNVVGSYVGEYTPIFLMGEE